MSINKTKEFSLKKQAQLYPVSGSTDNEDELSMSDIPQGMYSINLAFLPAWINLKIFINLPNHHKNHWTLLELMASNLLSFSTSSNQPIMQSCLTTITKRTMKRHTILIWWLNLFSHNNFLFLITNLYQSLLIHHHT